MDWALSHVPTAEMERCYDQGLDYTDRIIMQLLTCPTNRREFHCACRLVAL